MQPTTYIDKNGDTIQIHQRRVQGETWVSYLVLQWDRDWGRCTGGSNAYRYPPEYLWNRAGEFIMDDFGFLVKKRPCYDGGRPLNDTSMIWKRDRDTGAMINLPVGNLEEISKEQDESYKLHRAVLEKIIEDVDGRTFVEGFGYVT